MKRFVRKFLLANLLCAVNPVWADSDYETARHLREAGDFLPLEIILQKIQATHPGKVLEVELEEEHSQHVYEIELLDAKGKVWKLVVDPHTGELLEKRKDE
jgi:uncharacterized membrane protein YkoI